MPSATITSATMTSIKVKPRMRSAVIEALLLDLEGAVDPAGQRDPSAERIAKEMSLEPRHLTARQQHHLRLRRIDAFLVVLVLSIALQKGVERQLTILETQLKLRRRFELVRAKHAVARRIHPALLDVIVDVETVAGLREQDRV